MANKIKTLYSQYTSYGSKSKVLSEDVVPSVSGDSFAERLERSSNHVSKSKITGVEGRSIPAMIVKTETITPEQIFPSHYRAAAALKIAEVRETMDVSDSITVYRHYAIISGVGGHVDVAKIPPELLSVVYEIGNPDDSTEALQQNKKCVVEMLGTNYGIVKSQSLAGMPFVSGTDSFDLFDSLGGKRDAFVAPKSTTQLMNKNARFLIKLCKENGFNDKQTANFVAMAQGESGLVPKSELGYSGTSVKRIRAVFTSRINRLSDSEIETLKKDDVKFYNYVYHGPIGSEWFNKKLKKSGPGGTIGGYKYRGRGYIQHTGYTNYQRLSKQAGFDYYANPNLLNEPEHAARAFIAYYKDTMFARKNFERIVDTYEATYGGRYRNYNEHRRDDIRRRGRMAASWYRKIVSGEWKNM